MKNKPTSKLHTIMCTVLSPYFCPYNVVSLTHTHRQSSLLSSFQWYLICSQVARLPACATFRACMCHRVHLSLQSHTDFHLFDLLCHNIWTPRPVSSCTHPRSQQSVLEHIQMCYVSWLTNTPRLFHCYKYQTHSSDKTWHVYRGVSQSSLQIFPLFHIQHCL